MRIVPRTSYTNVFRRDFLKYDKFDFFWPQFAHLGEQAVSQVELNGRFAFVNDGKNDFGYQERYSEYKFIPRPFMVHFVRMLFLQLLHLHVILVVLQMLF